MIYLASPYSDPDPFIRNRRFIGAREFTMQTMDEGHLIFSPIVYGHQFSSDFEKPYEYEHWVQFNNALLYRATAVWVLRLKGWEKSRGIEYELRQAAQLALPISYKDACAHADF